MNLDGIEVFVKVVQAGSFSGAAKLMGMPTTTVSGKIQALERRLGTTLIHRTTRKLSVTEAGSAYYQRCLKALEEIEAGENELANVRFELTGTLRITTVPDIGHSFLPYYVKSYLAAHPKMKVELILTNRVVDLVAEGVDLAFRLGQLKDSSLIARKFTDLKGSLWATPAFIKKYGLPTNPKELKKFSFVKFSSAFNPLLLTNGKDDVEVYPEGVITVDDMQTAKSFTLEGMGIGLIPDYLCIQEEKNKKLVKILPKWTWKAFVTVSFVYPPQRFVSPKTQSFIEWCLKHPPRED